MLKKNNLLPATQSGFRSGYSCTAALLNIVDDIVRETDRGNITALCLLDYSKAFDRMHHDIFASILRYMGLSELASRLLIDYVSDRHQLVEINGRQSDLLATVCGCPQGSVLSPLIYTMYTSSFENQINFCKSHFYADDTQLYLSFSPNDVNIACTQINADLETLVKFSRRHNLVINPRKTEVILFGPGRTRDRIREQVDLFVDGERLAIGESVKNLGVIIDENLKFNEHINKCAQRAYNSLRLIYNNRSYLNQKAKRMLCDTLVLSCFNYADVLYSPFLSARLKYKIQKVQNSCLRTIYGMRRREHISHKLTEIGWLNMSSRRLLHSACSFYSIVATGKPPYLHDRMRFRSDVHTLNVRFKGLLTPPMHRTEFFKKGFSYQICTVYNGIISAGLGECTSVKSFKGAYRDCLFRRQCSWV